MTDVSVSHPAKRRRGRPRKDANLSLHSPPPKNPTLVNNNTQRAQLTFPTPSDAIKSNTQQLNTDPKEDCMVGTTIYGVIEGSFDAGYLISVRLANNDMPFRGVVFQHKKIVPVNVTNDVALQARMYQRQEITAPFSDNIFSPSRQSQKFAMQTFPASERTVFRPVLPFPVTPCFSNQSAFMFPNMGSPNVGAHHQTPPVMQAFEVSTSSKGANQKSQVHGKFVESAFGPGSFTHHNFMGDVRGPAFDIHQGEMIRREVEHPRQTTNMYYDEMRGSGVGFHHDLFTDQSQPDSTRLGPEFHQTDLVDSVSGSPNLKLDLSSSVHEKSSEDRQLEKSYLIQNEMKSPNVGYHHALVSGNPLLLPPEYTRQETSNESSPSGPYKLELATPQQSTVKTRPCEQTNSTSGCFTDMDFVLSDVVQPTEDQRDFSETKHR